MSKQEMVQGLSAVMAYLTAKEISLLEKLAVVILVSGYIISPVDIIPDVSIIGWIDDIGVGALFIYYCKHRVNSLIEKASQEGKKKVINITPENDGEQNVCKEIEYNTDKPFFFKRKGEKKKADKL